MILVRNLLLACGLLLPLFCRAASVPEFQLDILEHRFVPAKMVIPAHTRVKLIVNNRDPGAEEFESYELFREKIITGKSSATIYIGPLDPGEYPFFGDFNPDTAQGILIAE
jgi:hypothetical protein